MAAHQAPPSLGFSRQEHWSGLPFPSPMHESEKWKWSRSVVSDSYQPHGLQPTRLFHPWGFPGKSTGVGCHCLLRYKGLMKWFYLQTSWSFPGGSDSKESSYNAGYKGSIPGLGRSPGEGNGYLFQFSCLENLMDRGAWWAAVHGVAKSWTQLSN